MALPLDRMHTNAAAARRMRFVAIGCIVGAMALFSALDTTAKYLSAHESPLQVAWLRYVFHAVLVGIVLNPWTVPGVWRTKKPGLQFVRSVLLAATTVFNFAAISVIQLDQAISIAFITPLIVVALAGPLLGEWVDRKRLIVVLIGFGGVLLVMRPGFGTFEFAYLLALGNAICAAFYNMATRFVSAYDSARTSIAITGLFGAVALAPVMPFVWVWPENAWIWGLNILTGLLGAVGHFLLILAHGRAPAPVLAPFIYIELLFMILSGWFVFSNVPDVWTLAGAAVVIATGAWLLTRERAQAVDIVE